MQVLFETSRLTLRPRRPADTDACIAMDREPEVTRFIPGPWSDPFAHRAFVEARTRGPYPDGLGYWTVSPRGEPERFLGWVLLIPEDAKGPEIEIGWRFRRQAWGKGFATEAARPLVEQAFNRLHLPRIIADIHPENRGSRRVAEKLGFASSAGQTGGPYLRYLLTPTTLATSCDAEPVSSRPRARTSHHL